MTFLSLSPLRDLSATARETGRDLDQLADAVQTAWRSGNPWRVMVEFVALLTALFFLALMGMAVSLPLVLFFLWLQ